MFDYEEYEKECDKIRETNNEYLDLFEEDLQSAGLALQIPPNRRTHSANSGVTVSV